MRNGGRTRLLAKKLGWVGGRVDGIHAKMAAATDNGVSISGLIQNIEHSGFKLLDCLSEFIDNSIDAGARTIRLWFVTENDCLYVSDDATSMNPDKLRDSKILHNRSEADDSRNGRFGVGGKFAEAMCSKAGRKTNTYAKQPGKEMYQVSLNWPEYIANNKMIIAPHEATKSGDEVWQKRCIDPNQGTVLEVFCDALRFHDLLELVYTTDLQKNLYSVFGRMYCEYLAGGGKIVIGIDDEITEIESHEPLEWATTDPEWKKEQELNVYRTALGELLVRFKNGKGKEVHFEFGTTAKQPKQSEALPEGAVWLGRTTLQSTFKQEWSDNRYGQLGGVYLQRKKKLIEQIALETEVFGDILQRKVINHSRHKYTFGTSLDKENGVLLNKSHVNAKEIHPAIWRTVSILSRDWAYKLYVKKLKPVKEEESDSNSVRSIVGGKGSLPIEVREPEPKDPKPKAKEPKDPKPNAEDPKAEDPKKKTVVVQPPAEPIVEGYRFDITTQDIVVLKDSLELFRMNALGKGSHWREVLMETLRRTKNKDAFEAFLKVLEKGVQDAMA